MVIKFTSPWDINYKNLLPESFLHESELFFYFNDLSVNEADYWVIWGGLNSKEKVKVHSDNVIYIADESHKNRVYDSSFLNQFKHIAKVNPINPNQGLIHINEIGMWYFDMNYDDVKKFQPPLKTKTLSVVSSDLTYLPGHKNRFAFVNKMIGHFKDKIDVYGRGFNYVANKWDALKEYKYSIAIENNCLENYFTEKISDCFLAYTLPIYYGCPNIKNYYNSESYIEIDVNDYKKSILLIEQTIFGNYYEKRIDSIVDSRNRYLSEHHFYNSILKIINIVDGFNRSEEKLNKMNKKTTVQIYPEKKYKEMRLFDDINSSILFKEIYRRTLKKIF